MTCLMLAPPAHAQTRKLSVSFSPIHLFMPMLELTGELRLPHSAAVALIGGAGRVGKGSNADHFAFDVGAQGRWYALGSFDHGLMLGVEMLYLYVDPGRRDALDVSGEGLTVSPLVGYKVAFSFGLTLEGQLGFSFVAMPALTEPVRSWGLPLLNVGIGWSF